MIGESGSGTKRDSITMLRVKTTDPVAGQGATVVVMALEYNGQVLDSGAEVPYTGGQVTPSLGTIAGVAVDGSTLVITVK